MKIERIVFATGNAGKIREIQAILADLGLEVASMKEAGVSADIEEDGCTYEENALIKSRAVAACLKKAGRLEGTVVMADDSGLEIDYLNKEPGVFSARYIDRIIAKSIAALLLIADTPLDDAPAGQFPPIRQHCRNGADKPGRAPRLFHAFQTANQIGVLDSVRSVFPHIAGGKDSRLLIQIVDLQP